MSILVATDSTCMTLTIRSRSNLTLARDSADMGHRLLKCNGAVYDLDSPALTVRSGSSLKLPQNSSDVVLHKVLHMAGVVSRLFLIGSYLTLI